MKLHNLMEDEVKFIVDELLKNREDVCRCQKCKMDICAIALNKLPPKYVVTEIGELYGKVNNMNLQFEADVLKEVVKAIDKVKRDPKHNISGNVL